MKEIKSTLESKNFFVSLLTLAFMFLGSNEIFLNVTPEQLVDQLENGSLFTIIVSIIIPNLFNPVLKIIQKIKDGSFTWDFLKSVNFWTQVITVVLLGSTLLFPFEFPTDAAGNLVTAWDAGFIPFLGAVVVNIINPIWHFFTGKKKVVATPAQTAVKKVKISNN